MFDGLFKNLKATGPSAALCVLAICIAWVGIKGNKDTGMLALSVLFGLGLPLIRVIAGRSD